MKECLSSRARVFDFDDTLIGREVFTRVSGLVMGRIRPHRSPNLTITDISQLSLNHNRVDTPINSLIERISFEFHARRNVYPGVVGAFEKLVADGTDIYGNTGRSHKAHWVDMTEETLHRGRVAEYFRGVFYTPDGVRTAVSKAHALLGLAEQYEEVEFDDDDPRTARFIAKLFPNIKVNLIQHGSTGLLVSRSELDELPNLKRVAVFSGT